MEDNNNIIYIPTTHIICMYIVYAYKYECEMQNEYRSYHLYIILLLLYRKGFFFYQETVVTGGGGLKTKKISQRSK